MKKKKQFKTPARRKKVVYDKTPSNQFEFGMDVDDSATPGRRSSGISRKLSVGGKTPNTRKMVDAMTSPSFPIIPPPPPPSTTSSVTTTVSSAVTTPSGQNELIQPPPPPPQHQQQIQTQPEPQRQQEQPTKGKSRRKGRSRKRKKKKKKKRKKKKSSSSSNRNEQKRRRKHDQKKSSKQQFKERFVSEVSSQLDRDLPVSEQYIETIRIICNQLRKKYSSSKYKTDNEEDQQKALEIIDEFSSGMETRYQEYFKETVEEVADPRDEINRAKKELLEKKIGEVDSELKEWDRIEREVNEIEMSYPSMKAEDFNEEEILRRQQAQIQEELPKLDVEECLGEYEMVTDSLMNYSRNSSVLVSEGEEVSRRLVSRIKEMAEIDKKEKNPKDLMREFLN